MYVSTHIIAMSDSDVNASLGLRESGSERIAVSKKESDKLIHCCRNFIDSCFLTLFNDFLSQSRYADVKELLTSKQDVPNA